MFYKDLDISKLMSVKIFTGQIHKKMKRKCFLLPFGPFNNDDDDENQNKNIKIFVVLEISNSMINVVYKTWKVKRFYFILNVKDIQQNKLY